MGSGPHIVKKTHPSLPVRWYVYAWRGGPMVHSVVGGTKPALTPSLIDKIAEARRERHMSGDTSKIAGLIDAYQTSPEFKKLAKSTLPTMQMWLQRIKDKFGQAPIAAFEDRRMKGDILDWRDQWADKPRTADMAVSHLSRLLSWAQARGRVSVNICDGMAKLYESDRSDIIWEQHHFDAFFAKAAIEVREGVELAACTGLRRGDLVGLPWDAVGDHAILWQTSKSRGRNRIYVPLIPETLALLERIKARHAAEMQAQRPHRRKPMPKTILSNSRWQPWTPMGFGSRFNDAKVDSKIEVNLHDLRGTFVTRCIMAGLTDQQVADIVGWGTKDVAAIRIRYVDQARVVVDLGKRIARTSVNRL
ncbi:site-specific integrase [Novosphingobium sp. FKTRR1]|uniref:tyrosine-type recombinase/integrase n=1 Tax=Novosphingobium sp. FKTRR1 TaxID=2879118 RepID=UPI001CF0A90F|nr:site-specific integrase [Novosphingobium sp. FKTRR1]